MSKLKIFLTLFILNSTFYIGTASAQWWVQGGNLLWPYGNVTVQKNLNVGMNLTVADSIRFNSYASIIPYVFTEDGELVDVGFSFRSKLGADESFMTVYQNGLLFTFGASTRVVIGTYRDRKSTRLNSSHHGISYAV